MELVEFPIAFDRVSHARKKPWCFLADQPYFFFVVRRRDDDFFAGTFAPFFRASERPMAIACFRLFTRPPRPAFPLRSVPLLRLFIALRTDFCAPAL
jgi:hypothetical protein